jgi:hypothetical protein
MQQKIRLSLWPKFKKRETLQEWHNRAVLSGALQYPGIDGDPNGGVFLLSRDQTDQDRRYAHRAPLMQVQSAARHVWAEARYESEDVRGK